MRRIIDLIDPDGNALATAPENLRHLLSGFVVHAFDSNIPFNVRLTHFGGWAFSSSEGGGHLDIEWSPLDDRPLNYVILIMLGSGLVEAPHARHDQPLLAKSRQAALYNPHALPDALHFAGSLRNTIVFLPADAFSDLPLGVPISTDFGLGAVMSTTIRAVESQSSFGWADAMVGLLPDLANMIRHAFQTSLSGTAAIRDKEDVRLLRLHDFIHYHLEDPNLNARHAARACGLSLRQLHRLFEHSGSSFASTVRRLRMERASALLASTPSSVTVADVAVATGFADSAYFATAFRRYMGMPPSQWRREREAIACREKMTTSQQPE
ncbi:helix-turn-helix transcriptional regulator [Sphingobium algorifonticola]|uniref:AraC family transcriptional regulator n=1 Tax=Sphingobium algorifonticola TaxID=2008318 RepID=A0A437JA08_9SPHN|nr:helix-turn-helix transcriptional regulator [Sphingobium algorifonticola]RVT42349.1 AraC family transcriptional regulator [Sphingobium algorifonticola]